MHDGPNKHMVDSFEDLIDADICAIGVPGSACVLRKGEGLGGWWVVPGEACPVGSHSQVAVPHREGVRPGSPASCPTSFVNQPSGKAW